MCACVAVQLDTGCKKHSSEVTPLQNGLDIASLSAYRASLVNTFPSSGSSTKTRPSDMASAKLAARIWNCDPMPWPVR